jgi:hypothetical protein
MLRRFGKVKLLKCLFATFDSFRATLSLFKYQGAKMKIATSLEG